jgi:hypothetical protein
MKTSMYAALFSIVATSIAAIPASAAPPNDMLTTSGPPPAWRTPRSPRSNQETSVPKIKVDDAEAKTGCQFTLQPATTGGSIREQLEAIAKCNLRSQPLSQ